MSRTPATKRSIDESGERAITQRNRNSIAARIHALRRQKGLTLEQLAAKTDLDRGYLSRLERGQKTPSIAALMGIAAALDAQMAHLFGETVGSSAISVVRSEDQRPFPGPRSPTDHSFMMLLPQAESRRLSLVMISPGAELTPSSAEHPGEEVLFVLKGRVEVTFVDRKVVLAKGDCVHFDGHLRHSLRRVGAAPAQALIVLGQDLKKGPRTE